MEETKNTSIGTTAGESDKTVNKKDSKPLFGIFSNGILKENPSLVLVLGMCPTLAVTNSVSSAVGMGLATAFVLICSNFFISCLKKLIPDAVRLPCYIVIIAGFVTFVQLILQAKLPSLYSQLGVFLSLITVNCIVLARAEVFASKNKPIAAAADGLGMGLGFTLALTLMASVREIIGAGTFLGYKIPIDSLNIEPSLIFILPAGGFFTLGIIMALVGKLRKKPVRDISGCEGCPAAEACGKRNKF